MQQCYFIHWNWHIKVHLMSLIDYEYFWNWQETQGPKNNKLPLEWCTLVATISLNQFRLKSVAQRALVVQFCNPSHGTLMFGWMEHRLLVWFSPDHWKGYMRYLSKHSTTQAQHQGAGRCSKNEARIDAYRRKMWSTRSWVRILRRRSAFHIFTFNPTIMIVTMCLFCACCVLNHCKVATIKRAR